MRTAIKKAASNGRRLCAFRIRDANPGPVFFTGQGKVYQIPRRCQEKGLQREAC